jgi:hypothetical protein
VIRFLIIEAAGDASGQQVKIEIGARHGPLLDAETTVRAML